MNSTRWSLYWLFTALLAFGCTKEPETETLPSSDLHCTIDVSATYDLGTDPSQDFIAQSVPSNLTITSSTCPSLPAGSVGAGVTKYITRVDNTVTLSLDEEAYEDTIFDLTVSGLSISPVTFTHCYNGNRTIEAIRSASLDVANNELDFVMRYTFDADSCTGGMDPRGYEHSEIKGIWEEPCNSGSQHWMGYYANAAVDTTDYYSGGTCTGNLMYIEMNGPTVLGTQTSYPKDITTSYQNFYVYLYDSALAAAFNGLSMCGITTWTTGVDIDVKGRFCDFAAHGIRSSITFPSSELRHYDIFNLSGTVLEFGDSGTGDGTIEANRPTAIDSGRPYNFNSGYVVRPTWVD